MLIEADRFTLKLNRSSETTAVVEFYVSPVYVEIKYLNDNCFSTCASFKENLADNFEDIHKQKLPKRFGDNSGLSL